METYPTIFFVVWAGIFFWFVKEDKIEDWKQTSIKELISLLGGTAFRARMFSGLIIVALGLIGVDIFPRSGERVPLESYGTFEDRVR